MGKLAKHVKYDSDMPMSFRSTAVGNMTSRQLRRARERQQRKEQKIANKQRPNSLELLSQLNTVDIHNCS